MSLEACKKILDEISLELQDLKTLDASEMLRYVMQCGQKLPPLEKSHMVDENFVKGCVSNAYIDVFLDENKYVIIKGYSEAMIVKGFMGILYLALKEITVHEYIANGKKLIDNFLKSVDLDIILTPTRANSFGNIVAMIEEKAKSLV